MSDDPTIRVDNAFKSFGRRTALSDITLSVGRSEIFGLLGPSGSGKTTLVRLIAGLETVTSGAVFVFGVRVPELSLFPRIGYMAQADALYPELSAKENLEFFASLFGLSGARRKRKIAETLELVGLSGDASTPVRAFSGGMKRRLSLAAALVHEPELLLLDEPTVGIDPLIRRAIWDEIARRSRNGTTVVVTTHVMDEAERCHRLALLREGRLIAVGSPTELKSKAGVQTLEDIFLARGGMSP